MGIKLGMANIPYTIIERSDDFGGTWHANKYPGCACDIPSHLYGFSFAPEPNWTRVYPKQPEILTYLERLARRAARLQSRRGRGAGRGGRGGGGNVVSRAGRFWEAGRRNYTSI